jgi:hypothetical protein
LPSASVTQVLGNRLDLSALDVDPMDVEQRGMALVHRDQQLGRSRARVVDQLHAHVVERSEVARVGLRGGEIGRVQVIVLVAALVLHVQDLLAVARPQVAGDAARAIVGDAHLVVLADGAHPHVEAAVLGRKVRQLRAIGRDLDAGLLRVVEEVLQRDERDRRFCHGLSLRAGASWARRVEQ